MSNEEKKLSRSRGVAAKTLFKAFKVLKEAGGSLSGKEVITEIEKKLELTDWEKERYGKTGYIRWQSILHFFTIDAVKAGFMRKKKGVWILTPEGEEAMRLGPVGLLNKASEMYRKWAEERKIAPIEEDSNPTEQQQAQKANLSQLEEKALAELKESIAGKNPYEFQDMVAALLRAMGYYTPFISPRGKDDGIDVIAYQDPLGTKSPKIKVQVKHRPEAVVSVQDVKGLIGSLNKAVDVGIFVTSGAFSSEAERFTRSSQTHVELIDFNRLVSLWQEFYAKLTDEEKNMLPLYPIYFLGSNE